MYYMHVFLFISVTKVGITLVLCNYIQRIAQFNQRNDRHSVFAIIVFADDICHLIEYISRNCKESVILQHENQMCNTYKLGKKYEKN